MGLNEWKSGHHPIPTIRDRVQRRLESNTDLTVLACGGLGIEDSFGLIPLRLPRFRRLATSSHNQKGFEFRSLIENGIPRNEFGRGREAIPSDQKSAAGTNASGLFDDASLTKVAAVLNRSSVLVDGSQPLTLVDGHGSLGRIPRDSNCI